MSIYASVAMIRDPLSGLYLSATRIDTRKIAMPGGKIEPNETPRMAVARELTEESGIRIPVDDFKFLYSGFDEHAHHSAVFYAEFSERRHGTPISMIKGIDISWQTRKRLCSDFCEFPSLNRQAFASLDIRMTTI